MKKKLLLVIMLFMPLLIWGSPKDDRGEPSYHYGYTLDDQYIIYFGGTRGMQRDGRSWETIYTWKETEEINGKTYMVVYDAYHYLGYTLFKLHMRREGSQIRVIYEEYKQLMHDRKGRDMSDYDNQCPYEVTDDGEMVLYDFDMQPGDKFRSIEGREDVYVVRREKMSSYILTDLDNPQGLLLSNGVFILDNVGAAYYIGSYTDYVDVDFFDYLHPEKGLRAVWLWHAQLGATRIYDDHSDGETEIILPEIDAPQGENTYDLFGRKVSHISSPGIYIRNGRKYVVK